MKAVMLMYDSLNRHMLPPYGCDWVHAPNFARLAEKTVVFDNCYIGSMACMPARRDLHTGRYNFLHRCWGPLEPFDDSMPEILKQNGIHSHLVSDHYHYWEEGGANYHTKYATWELSRGQEGDPWIGDLNTPPGPHPNPDRRGRAVDQDWINRRHMPDERDLPQPRTVAMGLDFIERNRRHDNWFLQIETFDPHEPYFVPERFQQLYDHDFKKILNDWPQYARAGEQPELTRHYRFLNAALISMCDHYLGRVLDAFDRHGLWSDTMLIVNTDHGFLLGEHDWWGKVRMPHYNEVARIPLFIWDPRSAAANVRRESLVQNIDLAPTLLDYFNLAPAPDMRGRNLAGAIAGDRPVRTAALFGHHGGHVNCTDGRFVYMRAPANPDNTPLYNYTLMPAHMKAPFSLDELSTMQACGPLPFSKKCPVMKIDASGARAKGPARREFGTMLFDLNADPGQAHPVRDDDLESHMQKMLADLLREHDAPSEQFVRMGLD